MSGKKLFFYQNFLRRCPRNECHRENNFFCLGGWIFEGGKENPSDFASDFGEALVDGGDAEAPADVCVVETAEAEIFRDAKADGAGCEEDQFGDAVVFGDDGGDAVAVHGEELFLKWSAFGGEYSRIRKFLTAANELPAVRCDSGGFHFVQKSGETVAHRRSFFERCRGEKRDVPMPLCEQMAGELPSAVVVVADDIVQIRAVCLLVDDDDRAAGEHEIVQFFQVNIVALWIIDKPGNVLCAEQFQRCAFFRGGRASDVDA